MTDVLTRPPRRPLPAAPSRLDSLTGLRFFAALAVFSTHIWFVFSAAGMRPFRDLAKEPFEPGATGVIFFFALSGFVLTWSAENPLRAGPFYRRRFARIVPNYLVVWLAMATVAVINGHGFGLDFPASLFLVQAWFPSDDIYFGFYAVLWSLSVEIFFYAVFPYVLPVARRLNRAGRRIGMAAVLLTTISVGVATAPQPTGSFRLWVSTVFPIAELSVFLLGVLLAVELRRSRLPSVSLALAVTSVALGWAWLALTEVRTSHAAVMLVPYCMLIVAAAQADLAQRSSVLAGRLLKRLGAWSYAFFLLHVALLLALVAVMTDLGIDLTTLSAVQGAGMVLLALAVTVAASALLFTVVERPCELWLRPRGRDRVSAAPEPAAAPDRAARRWPVAPRPVPSEV